MIFLGSSAELGRESRGGNTSLLLLAPKFRSLGYSESSGGSYTDQKPAGFFSLLTEAHALLVMEASRDFFQSHWLLSHQL